MLCLTLTHRHFIISALLTFFTYSISTSVMATQPPVDFIDDQPNLSADLDRITARFHAVDLEFKFTSIEKIHHAPDIFALTISDDEIIVTDRDVSLLIVSQKAVSLDQLVPSTLNHKQWKRFSRSWNKKHNSKHNRKLVEMALATVYTETDSLRVFNSSPSLLPGVTYYMAGLENKTSIDNFVVKGKTLLVGAKTYRLSPEGNLRPEYHEGYKHLLRKTIAKVSKRDKIYYATKNKPAHTITVFTDINCGYCRRLHSQIEDYTSRDIAIQYLPRPSFGGAKSFHDAKTVWCAKNKRSALDSAMAGNPIEQNSCANNVEAIHRTFSIFNFQGVPIIVLENGQVIEGYLPADKLVNIIKQQ